MVHLLQTVLTREGTRGLWCTRSEQCSLGSEPGTLAGRRRRCRRCACGAQVPVVVVLEGGYNLGVLPQAAQGARALYLRARVARRATCTQPS